MHLSDLVDDYAIRHGIRDNTRAYYVRCARQLSTHLGRPAVVAGNEPLRSWDWAQGEHGADTSTCVPGAMFLLSHPELIQQGLEITKNSLMGTGLSEAMARKVVETVNRAAAEPGAKIGWIQDKRVHLPWS